VRASKQSFEALIAEGPTEPSKLLGHRLPDLLAQSRSVRLVFDGVQEAGGGGLDRGDHGGDPLYAERAGTSLSQPGMRGLVQADMDGWGLWPAPRRIFWACSVIGPSGAWATAAE
jgi:hypothetical protein